ncbi:hypothetical protein [Actinomadura bangladeshensis]|uniref:Uncharacterized protein n=1 Tax=Actinomadura bangladeshensis TaxID=453573 RepID=A0A6L9Q9T9_9ACTN|nr:hypothetical protein [Actinomadura bangladeshensis]NEA21054.1 hypothetical protein [Actinomadura bangladeshensis]
MPVDYRAPNINARSVGQHLRQIREILDSYGTPRHIRDAVVDLASRPDGPPWLARHVGRLKALVRDIYTVESESALVHIAPST